MKKILFCLILSTTTLFSWSLVGGGGSQTLVVDANPSCWLIGCSSCEASIIPDNPYTTIQAAVNAASEGDTISICDGTYDENNIKITKNSLIIKSHSGNRNNVIVEDNSNNPIFKINTYISNLTIQDLTIQQKKNNKTAINIDSGGSGYTFKNLDIKSEGNAIVQNNGTFQNSTFENIFINSKNYSIYMKNPEKLTCYDLNITSTNGNALYFVSPRGYIFIDIRNKTFNTINSYDTAMYFGNTSQNYTINNTKIITSKQDAASITAQKIDALKVNNIDLDSSRKGSGIWVNGTVNTVDINGSNFHDIKNEDIYVKKLASSGSKITNNAIDLGSTGIYIYDSSNAVTIENNIIKNTTLGLKLLYTNKWVGSKIDHNCFISNGTSAFSQDKSAIFDNGSEGNYWSDWSGSGKYTIGNIPRYDNYPLSSCPVTLSSVVPLANYQMDECSWDGTTGEVKDSSDNSYDGTAKSGANTESNTTESGGIGRVGNFNDDSYIELSSIPNLTSNMTITAWFKTTDVGQKGQRIFADDESNTKGYALSVADNNSPIVRFYDRSQSRAGIIDSNSVIQNDMWYFVAAVTDVDNAKRYLYLYDSSGTLIGGTPKVLAMTNTSRGIDSGVATIGGESDNGETGNRFKGSIDEVKIFDKALTSGQITSVYRNEKDGKNYDGTPRDAPCCCLSSIDNLIANPSFEIVCESQITQTWNNVAGGTVNMRKNLCGWNLADGSRGMETWENTTQKPASDGDIFAEIDGYSDVVDSIWQLIDAEDGEYYTIKFDYRKRDNNHKDDIVVKWNDDEILNIIDTNTSEEEWRTAIIYVKGTANKDKLSFEEPSSANDSYGSWIDNIRVAQGGPPIEIVNYKFDAWDTFRDIQDRNISTKIVNQDFNLTIASLSEDGSELQDFNGTVCTQIQGDNNWKKSLFEDANTSTSNYNMTSAMKDTLVNIKWWKDQNKNCIDTDEDNETNSTDNFAIRPEKFNIDFNTTSFSAGVPFHIDINASQYGGGYSKDYNETNGTSFVFDINDSNSTCNAGILGNLPSPFKFTDGNISFDTNYSDVGDVNFTIKEDSNCSKRFAHVDCDDNNVSGDWNTSTDLSIEANSTKITFKPYQFAIVDYNFTTRNPNQDWLYMSDVNESNITISFKVQARNMSGKVTPKFSKECYAHNVNVDINLTSTSNDANISYYRQIDNSSTSDHNISLNDINWTSTINDQNFTDGNSSQVVYALNIYREFNNTKNPIDINVTDINTTDANAINIGKILDNNGSTFYYGRVKTEDISTNEQSISHSLHVEVYSKSKLKNFQQESLNWYKNEDDSNTTILDLNSTKDFKQESKENNVTISPHENLNIGDGNVSFNISNTWNTTNSAYIHVNIPKYLWYSKYKDYNSSGDCSEHPCFRYNYNAIDLNNNIHSGDFSGSSIGKDFNATNTKRGVKTFR